MGNPNDPLGILNSTGGDDPLGILKKKVGGSVSTTGAKTPSQKAVSGIDDLHGTDAPSYYREQKKSYEQAQMPDVEDDPIGNAVRPIKLRRQEIKQQVQRADQTYNPQAFAARTEEARLLKDQEEQEIAKLDIPTAKDAKNIVQGFVAKITPNAPQLSDLSVQQIEKLLPSGNITAKLAFDQYARQRNIQEAMQAAGETGDVIQNPRKVGRELIRLTNPKLDETLKGYERGGSFELNNYGTGYTSVLEKTGLNAVKDFLDKNPDLPNHTTLKEDYNNWVKDYKVRNTEETAAAIREKIGQKLYDKRGFGASIYRTQPSQEEIAEAFDELKKEGKWDAQDEQVFKEYVQPLEKRNIGTDIPMSGFANKFGEGVANAAKGTINVFSSDDERRMEQSSEMFDTRYQSVKNKAWYDQFLDGVGDMTGQVAWMAVGAKGIGGMGKLAGLGKLAQSETANLWLNSFLTAYDSHAKEALEALPSDDDYAARKLYAFFMTGMEAASEGIFKDTKVLDAFKKSMTHDVAALAKGVSSGYLSKQAANSQFKRILSEKLTPFAKEFAKESFQNATEEAIIDPAQAIADAVIAGKDVNEYDVAKKAVGTFVTTALYSPIVAAAAALKDSRKPTLEKSIYAMASNPEVYAKQIETQAKADPNFPAQVAQSNLEHASKVVKDLEKTDLTTRQKEKYLLHSLNEKVLQDELDNTTDSNLQDRIKEQIKVTKEAKEKLLLTRQEQIAAKEEKQADENKETQTEVPQIQTEPVQQEQVNAEQEAPPPLSEQELSQMQPEDISEDETDDGIWMKKKADMVSEKAMTTSRTNNVSEPTVNKFKEGDLAVDGLTPQEDGYVYQLRYVDPNEIEYTERDRPEDEVRGWETTKKYAEWFKEGKEPEPITLVYNKSEKKLLSTNRRRIVAARAAGVDKIPAWVEVGKHSEIVKDALEKGKYQKAIAEGRMTVKDAKEIIESVGLKVPEDISQPQNINNERQEEGQKGLLEPYTTKNGKYTISIENGQRVIRDKDGNEPSEKTARTYLNEHAESLNYNQGQTVEQKGVEPPQFSNQEEGGKWIAENSDNPSEIADLYLKTEKQPTAISSKEQAILTGIDSGIALKTTEDSYRRFGDANNQNNAKARFYFDNKGGRSMDEIAREISDHTGMEVTPQDVADFIDRFPSGDYQARRMSDTEVHTTAKQRFEQLTGVPLTDKIATLAANQLYSPQAIAEAEQVVDSEPLPEAELLNWLTEEVNNIYDEENTNLEYESAQNTTTNTEQPTDETNVGQNTGTQAGRSAEESAQQGGTETTSGEEVKKTITTKRAYEGAFREGVKKELEKLGLTREVESQSEAKQRAKDFIASVGEDTALDAVRNNDVPDAAGAYIWNELIESLDRQILSETNPEKISELEAKQAGLINELSRKALSGGRFASALGDIYANSDLGYKLEVKIQQFKDQNGGVIPADVEAKFRKLDEQLKEVQKQLVEAEKRAKDAEAKAALAAIKEAEARKKSLESKKSYSQKAKETADKVRKLKNKPLTFKDADGNDIPVHLQGITWNDLVEAAAKIIEKTGQIADGIAHIVSELQKADWYQKLDDRNRNAVIQQIEDYFNQDDSTTDGKIKIKHSLIREAVEQGNDDIDSVVSYIKERIKDEYPDASDRDIRDAVTNYGRVINPNQEEIETKIRKIKRIGRIVSGLEDIANKKRPLRSGAQRDKLDAEERAMQKELREAMKELPMDTETEAKELKTAVDAAKQRLRNHIEDLQRQIDTGEKVERSKRALPEDDELKELREERDRVKEEFENIFGSNELSDEQKLQNAIKSVQRSIDEYERRIKEKDTTPKKKASTPNSDELKNLKTKRDSLKEDYKKMLDDEGVIQQRRLDNAKKRAQGRIEDLQRRLKEGDFSKKVTKPVKADTELIKLNAEKLRIQEEYDKEFYKNQLQNRTKGEKIKDTIWELWGITRALRATGEMSFIGVQGLIQTIAHPIHAAKSFRNAIRFMLSEKKAEQWLREVKSQEWYPTLKESKLALTEPHAEVTAREELFYSGWTNIIWDTIGYPLKWAGKDKAFEGWKNYNPFKMLERAAVGYLDTIRVERFLDGMQMLQEQGKDFQNNKQDYKDVADAINTLTGRASLGKAELIAPQLAKIFFSPRNWASAIKTSTPYALYHFGKMTPTARKMAIYDFSKWVGVTTGMVMAAAAYYNNDDDDETGVEFDPRSSDFMKIKIGDTRIDPWGGRIQMIVLQSRLLMDAMKNNQGKIVPLGTPNKAPTRQATLITMATNKLAPSAAIINKYLNTKWKKEHGERVRTDEYGNPYHFSEEIKSNLYPIYWDTISDLTKDDPNAMDGVLLFLSFFGMGVNKYENKKKEKKSGGVTWK